MLDRSRAVKTGVGVMALALIGAVALGTTSSQAEGNSSPSDSAGPDDVYGVQLMADGMDEPIAFERLVDVWDHTVPVGQPVDDDVPTLVVRRDIVEPDEIHTWHESASEEEADFRDATAVVVDDSGRTVAVYELDFAWPLRIEVDHRKGALQETVTFKMREITRIG